MNLDRKTIDLGENIKKIRKFRGLTQKELAEKLKVTVITIQNYENNRREPNLSTIEKIADVLNVTVSELLGFETVDIEGNPLDNEYGEYKNKHVRDLEDFKEALKHMSDKNRIKLLNLLFDGEDHKEFVENLTEEDMKNVLLELKIALDFINHKQKLKNNKK